MKAEKCKICSRPMSRAGCLVCSTGYAPRSVDPEYRRLHKEIKQLKQDLAEAAEMLEKPRK